MSTFAKFKHVPHGIKFTNKQQTNKYVFSEKKYDKQRLRKFLFLKNSGLKKRNLASSKKFDVRKNYSYKKQLKSLFVSSKLFSIPLTSEDFKFFFYYKKLMKKKIVPSRWPIFKIEYKIPVEFTPKRFYLKRKQWKAMFRSKIKLIRIYHKLCSKWYTKYLLYNAPLYKKRLTQFHALFKKHKVRYLLRRKKNKVDQKKPDFYQKFNKEFRLFKVFVRKNRYNKHTYQLKLLQKQFINYLQLTPYFYKQLQIFYKQFSFCSQYEKFFLVLYHRIVIILHKLRYFSPYYIVLALYYKILIAGLILLNGKIIKNPYLSVWINDHISIAYRLYCFEVILMKKYYQLKIQAWNGDLKKKFFHSKNYKPYMLQNKRKHRVFYENWAISSVRVNSTIIINNLPKFFRKKILPFVYNYINLQIVSELLPYKKY